MTAPRRLDNALIPGLVLILAMHTTPGTCAAEPTRAAPDAHRPLAVEPGHPRIFFTAKDLPALRKRIQTTHAQQWRGMKKWADSRMGGKWSDSERLGYVPTYGFLYQLSGETSYADEAISMARSLLSVDFAGRYDADARRGSVRPMAHARHPHNRAHRAAALAFVYDWCHDRLTAEDKAEILEGLDALGGLVYDVMITHFPGNWSDLANHRSDNIACLGLAGLAMHGDHPNAAKYVGGALSSYTQGIIPALRHFCGSGDGMWHEGMEYTRAELGNVFRAFAAFGSALGEDLFAPEFEQLAYGTLYGTYPDKTLLRGNDAHHVSVATKERKYLATLAARYRNPHAQWYANHMTRPIARADGYYDILWYDPAVPETPPDALPLARHFSGMGMAVLRTDWYEPDATVVTFKCGDFFWGHNHYDQNSFTIYRKGHLAIDSGGYDSWYSPHWRNYYCRTVAHNTITVFDPAEDRAANFDSAVNDGGQIVAYKRNGVVTGPYTLDQFLRNPHYDTGNIVVFEQAPGYARVLGDATRAYSAQKLRQFTRELVVVHPKIKTNPPAIVVFDQVEAARPDYSKKWLLHTVNEPERIAPGTYAATEGDGKLYLSILAPQGATVTLVGGAGREFEVNGKNYPLPEKHVSNKPPNVPGAWRIEVEPAAPAERDLFLNVLMPVDKDQASIPAVSRMETANMLGGLIRGERGEPDTVVWFARDRDVLDNSESLSYRLTENGETRHLIAGLPASADYAVRLEGKLIQTQRTQDARTQEAMRKGLAPSCSLSFTVGAGAGGTIAIEPVSR